MSLRNDRFGLVLIASSLLVIILICGLHVASQLKARRDQNRAQGVSLARILSTIPYDRLLPRAGQQGPLDVVKTSQTNPDFAYSAIVAIDGRPLAQVTAPGTTLPAAALPSEPAAWIGERVVDSSAGGRQIREFIAPVITDGDHVAHLRVGFFEPGFAAFLEQASFLGMMALPIFLLTPLAYFLIRRGLRPLVSACSELNDLVEGRRFDTVQIEATGEVGEFIRGFNRFMKLAKSRVQELEEEKASILVSSKVLTYQRQRVEAVLEGLPDATLLLDEAGNAVFANRKLEPVLGISSEKVVGRKPEEWCDRPEIISLLAKSRGLDSQRQRSDGVEISVEGPVEKAVIVSTHPLISEQGSPAFYGTLVVARDITSDAVAKRTQGEFMAQMAHELKNPLNVMSMYGESLLGEEGESESFRVEAANVIRDEVERLATLIATLLSIARIESGAGVVQRQRVRLQDFLADAVEAASRTEVAADVSIQVDVPKDTSPIFVEKELFRVAINNLLTNAIKYNREGGHVIVSVEENANQINIRVRDSGIGIREEDLPHVFEKFYRSDDVEIQKRAGHGLGLPLAKEIVELHAGTISVQTHHGQGSEFTITLRKRSNESKEESNA